MAGSGIALAQMANANLNPRTESKVDTKNPDRGPLLILEGEKDHTVPWAIANASYKRQKRNPSVTEIKKMPNRGHSLTIDHGWQEVSADRARLRQAVRPGQAELAGLDLPPEFPAGGDVDQRPPRAHLYGSRRRRRARSRSQPYVRSAADRVHWRVPILLNWSA